MTATSVSSRWDNGSLVFFDQATGATVMTLHSGTGGMSAGGSTNKTVISPDGTQRLHGAATAWKDMIGDLMGKRLNSVAGKIVYDWDDNAIAFGSGGAIADAADRVQWNQEINHEFMVGSGISFFPHIHWFQGATTKYVLTLEYRLQRNGQLKTTAWQSVALTASNGKDSFPYTGGTTLCQITSTPGPITIDCGVSDTLQFRMARTDSLGGTMLVYFLDLHGPVDSFGSETEYDKL